jgi:putative acetyltransferase
MDVFSGVAGREQAIIELFAAAFTASEGDDEGARIGGLVREPLADSPSADIRAFRAEDGDRVIGAAVFTRLTFAEDPPLVVLLSPCLAGTISD